MRSLGENGNLGEHSPVAGAQLEGISLCPETAVCLDCLESLIAAGKIGANEEVVVFNTGAAQKYPEIVSLDLPRIDKDRAVDYAALAS